ncbi:unnamed protein product [Adineta ricciae]|uniref:Uncharacterized protein n=1 Tax=Adineta ricciae TaxID=249248 RepID=A0A813RQB1_ADIRI|nr:unnamed protein product [Adineta ricciae]
MGHLFTRMATIWLEEQRAQNNLTAFQSNSNKRKRSDLNELSNKRKASSNSTSKTESDDEDERLTLSPRICPIITKSSTANHRSIQSLSSFKCQLCRRCLRNKDLYMEHMMLCAFQRQAAIKIVRAGKNKTNISIR